MIGPQLAAIVYGALAVIGLFVLAALQQNSVVAFIALLVAAGSYVAQTFMNGDLVTDDDNPETVQQIGLYLWLIVIVAWIAGLVLLGVGI